MFKIITVFIIGFCLHIGTLAAQEFNNSLLWKISGNGLTTPSYIFGTIHMIAQKDFVVQPEVDFVFNLAGKACFELKMDDISMLATYNKWLTLPDGKTLKDYCTETEFIQLKQYLQDSLQTDIQTIINQKPFVIYQMQSTNFIKDEMASFELYFVQNCIQKGKPIGGLEKLETQLAVFDEIPYEEQIDWVVESINQSDSSYRYYDTLIHYYLKADLLNLSRYIKESDEEFKKYGPLMLDNRNINWIPVIEEQIKLQSTFIAVGAGHLVGEKGILQLLHNQGYVISPIQ